MPVTLARTVRDQSASRMRRSKSTQRQCSKCGTEHGPKELFFYVDGNNAAITQNNPPLCMTCYVDKWGDK